MSEAILSSKFQIVIPREIRRQLSLQRGQKMRVVARGGIIYLVPDRPLPSLRGLLRGMDTSGLREEEERI